MLYAGGIPSVTLIERKVAPVWPSSAAQEQTGQNVL